MENIGIFLNNEFLDLDNSSIRLEKINPFFVNDQFQGDFSFPFDIPATEKNLRLLGFPNFIDGDKTLNYYAVLFLFGVPQAQTKLVVTRGKPRSISVVLIGGIKSLKSADMKLSELPLGDDVFLGFDTAEIKTKATLASKEGNWQVYGFTFVPFYMPDFYDGKNSDFNGVVNQTDSTNGNILCDNSAVIGNPHTLVPWIFLFNLLNKIFEYEGLNPSGPFWENEECSKILLTNTYSLDGGIADGGVRADTALGFDNDFGPVDKRVLFQVGPVNTYDTTGGWNNIGTPGSYYVINQIGTHYIDVVLKSKSLTALGPVPSGAIFFGTFVIEYDFVEVARLSIDLSLPEDQESFMSYTLTAGIGDIGKTILVTYYYEYAGSNVRILPGSSFKISIDTPINTLASKLSFKNHMADQTVGEFLSEIKKLGVVMDFDFQANKVSLAAVDHLINYSERVNWTQKAAPGYDLSMEDAGKGVSIFYEFDSDEKVNLKLDESKFKGEFNPRTYLPNPAQDGEWIIISGTNEILTVGKNPAGVNEWQTAGYNYRPRVIGNGESELTCKLAPVQMITAWNANGTPDQNFALVPRLFGSGYSGLLGSNSSSQKFRLAFWRGQNRVLSFLPQGGNYTLASSGIFGVNGDTYGKTSLRLDQDTGIILKNSQKLYNAINRGEIVEKDIDLNALDLYNLKNFMLVDLDFNTFLIKSISTNISTRRIESKAYLLKI